MPCCGSRSVCAPTPRSRWSTSAITIVSSVVLVVALHDGARGLLLGNYGATTVVLLGLWWTMRRRLVRRDPSLEPTGVLLRFGLPTVPAEASVYALSIIDRYYIFHHRSPALAGLYSIAVKLAGVVAFIVRAFQYAWPPLAYSVRDDAEAARLYGLVTTYYLLVSGLVVAGLALLGRWVLRLLAAPAYFDAYRALPWVALGWAMYGLWVVFLVIAGRAKVTTRNFPAALAGLLANVVLLLVLVPRWGIAGAGVALCGAYVVMIGFMHLLIRRAFAANFEWRRLGPARGRAGRDGRRRRGAPAHPRGGRPADPRRRAGRHAAGPAGHRVRAPPGARAGARAAEGGRAGEDA